MKKKQRSKISEDYPFNVRFFPYAILLVPQISKMHLLFVLDEVEKNIIFQINKHFYHDVYVFLSKEGGNIPLFQTEVRIMSRILVRAPTV
jgi:hypothetical protein